MRPSDLYMLVVRDMGDADVWAQLQSEACRYFMDAEPELSDLRSAYAAGFVWAALLFLDRDEDDPPFSDLPTPELGGLAG
jgi:hypothetical protein